MFSTKSKKSTAPPPPGSLRVFELLRVFLRRRHTPWEVVDHKYVQPVPTFYDDEDVDILHLSASETRGTYVFEVHATATDKSKSDQSLYSDVAVHSEQGRKALIFARQQLMTEISKKDCNVLFAEGWGLTILRRGKRVRFEVEYNGRGAFAVGKLDLEQRQPPFLELLGRTGAQMQNLEK